MYYISEYNNKKEKFKIRDDNGSKLLSHNELQDLVKSGTEVYGVTNTVWFLPLTSEKISNTELKFTFAILNTNIDWISLVPNFDNNFFSVDVLVDCCKVKDVKFYYTYTSGNIYDITSKVDKYFISYVMFYGVGLYQRFNNVKDYNELAIHFAEKYGIVEYRVKGNLMIYNKSYPAYLSNPRYTVQHCINLDTGKDTTKRLKRFDKNGYLNT